MTGSTADTDDRDGAGAEAGPADTGPAEDAPEQDALTAAEIAALRVEIDRLDTEILALVKRRSVVSQEVGRARMATGGPRIVYSREMAVLERFRDLGPEGYELAMLLLRLGRGRLGGR